MDCPVDESRVEGRIARRIENVGCYAMSHTQQYGANNRVSKSKIKFVYKDVYVRSFDRFAVILT